MGNWLHTVLGTSGKASCRKKVESEHLLSVGSGEVGETPLCMLWDVTRAWMVHTGELEHMCMGSCVECSSWDFCNTFSCPDTSSLRVWNREEKQLLFTALDLSV